MNKIVVISGGFHPFHAGHASLYQEAKKAFPDAQVVIGATNSQKDRPFPFKIKQKLAQVSGVPPKDFVEVSRQFSGEDPAIASRIKNPNDTILIFARSEKDKGEPPLPAQPDPKTGKLPLVTRGANKGKPVSNYLQYFAGNEDNLEPMTQHAYMAYLPTVEFGPGITSASEIRSMWPKLNEKRKTAMVMSLYPATQKNPKLAANVVKLLDAGMGVELEEDLSRRGFLKGAGAIAAGASLGGVAKAADNPDPNRLIATVNIEGESKEFDLTGKFKGDVKSQLRQADEFLTNFLEKRDINFSNLELRYQGAVLRTQNTGSVNEKMKMGATIEPIEESIDYLDEK